MDELEIPFLYDPKFREYGLRILDGGTSQIPVNYCPWCGKKLPTSLRDKWFAELKALKIDPGADKIPEKYQTDEWYK